MRHGWATLLGTLAMVARCAVFDRSTVFVLGPGTGTLGHARPTFLLCACIAVRRMAVGIPLSGPAADRFGRRPAVMSGTLFTMFLGLPLGPMLGSGSWPPVPGFRCLGLFAMGWTLRADGGAAAGAVPDPGTSVTYSLAGIIGASAAPHLAQSLVAMGGIAWVGAYLGLAAAMSFAAVLLMPETARQAV